MTPSQPHALSRRRFFARVAVAGLGALATGVSWRPRALSAQSAQPPGSAASDSSNLFAMDQTASRPVARPPKPGARASMTVDERDELEHHIRCQCGCTLDVYTCRTTDFSCRVSPSMHRDVIGLVEGGYTAPEIIDAFTRVYGERALMAPTKDGFNLFGWLAPFGALAGGAVALLALLKSWKRPARAPAREGPSAASLGASDEELARLDEAVRDDG